MIGWNAMVRCPLCNSREKSLYAALQYGEEEFEEHEDLREIKQDDEGGVVLYFSICECGLVYVDRVLDDLDKYYGELYTPIHESRIGRAALDQNELERATRIGEGWPDAQGEQKVLDIGCGAGIFMNLLQAKGYIVEGVDLRPEHCNFDIKIHTSLSEIPADSKYDVISMIHMVEHLPDPIPYMEGLRGLLAEGGQIFIEVPNFSANKGTLSVNHPLAYSTHTMKDLLRKSGLVPSTVGVVPIVDTYGGWKTVIQAIARLR
jgi:2-polyprenyl-3-methyl-5-hydroxy-6-metoxy-1,4-benzoquinol methylase